MLSLQSIHLTGCLIFESKVVVPVCLLPSTNRGVACGLATKRQDSDTARRHGMLEILLPSPGSVPNCNDSLLRSAVLKILCAAAFENRLTPPQNKYDQYKNSTTVEQQMKEIAHISYFCHNENLQDGFACWTAEILTILVQL